MWEEFCVDLVTYLSHTRKDKTLGKVNLLRGFKFRSIQAFKMPQESVKLR